MTRRVLFIVMFAGAALATPPVQAAAADGPLAVIRRSNVAVSKILRPGHTVTAADRAAVSRILDQVTDFAAVSRNVLGSRWPAIPSDQQAAFTTAFARLVCASSIAKMGRYRADRLEYLSETITGDGATVKTRAYYRGRGVSLDYEMALTGGRWRIVNYAFNRVDNAESYRRQFEKLLEKETVAALIVRLNDKAAEIESGGVS